MTVKPPSSDLLAAMLAEPEPEINPDKLAVITQAIQKAFKIETYKKRLEDLTEQSNSHLKNLYHRVLPDLMDEAQIPKLTVQVDDELGKVEAKADAYYRANIPADWPEEDREKAFDWLAENGHGDLIKVEVAVAFPREKFAEAMTLQAALRGPHLILTGAALDNFRADTRSAAADQLSDEGKDDDGEIFSDGHPAVSLKKNIPWATLTSWLKEQYGLFADGKIAATPPLDILGATVGRIVKLKPKD